MYEVYLEDSAKREFLKLQIAFRKRIVEQFRELEKNPRKAGSRKLVGSDNDWRIRVGDFRIVYEIDDDSKIIKVNRIRHRKEVCR